MDVEVFYSYAAEDEKLRQELAKHLSVLRRTGRITEWYAGMTPPGGDQERESLAHLNAASLVLLLITPDFMNSDYCYSVELQLALKRHANGEARAIPVLLKPFDLVGTPLEKLKPLPRNGLPVTHRKWGSRATGLAEVAIGLRMVIEDLVPVPTPAGSIDGFERIPVMLKYDIPGGISEFRQLPGEVVRGVDQPPIWAVPHRRNFYFTGQRSLLGTLYQGFTFSRAPRALYGLGGVGKTQLALEYAQRYRYDYDVVCWVNAETHEARVQDFVRLARLLELPGGELQESALAVQAVRRWLETHGRWLLIFDNADDPTEALAMLPETHVGHVLLTTRTPLLDPRIHGLSVEPMEMEDGTLFLLRRSRTLGRDEVLDASFSHAHLQEARAIVELLGGLPLALDQAGAYIEEVGCSILGYRERYMQHSSKLAQRRGSLPSLHPQPYATTWSLSFAQIEQSSPIAAALLRCCAFLHPDAIPEEIITKGVPGPELAALTDDLVALDDALGVLLSYSLIKRTPGEQVFSMHRLVQEALRDSMREQRQRQWAERVVYAVNAVFPHPQQREQWSRAGRYILHAQRCAHHIERWHLTFEEAAFLLSRAGYYLQEQAQYAEAEALLQRVVAITEHLHGPQHPDVASSLNNLADLYIDQGKYEQVEPLYQRALTINEQASGPEHPDVASSLNNLAILYRHQGKYKQAELKLADAVSKWRQIYGDLHQKVAFGMTNLAMIYSDQGKNEKAEKLLLSAVAMREQTLGSTHPDVAHSIANLATIYRIQGKYDKAEKLYQQALYIREQAFGADHFQVAFTLNNLATLYVEMGSYEQAEILLHRSLATFERTLGLSHPQVAYSLINLASFYRDQNEYEQAEPLFQRALKIIEDTFGPDHPDVVIVLENYAELLRKMKRDVEAAEAEARIRTIQAKRRP